MPYVPGSYYLLHIWYQYDFLFRNLIFTYIIISFNFTSSGLIIVYGIKLKNAQNSGDIIQMSSFHWDNGKCKLCDQQHISSGVHKCIACFVWTSIIFKSELTEVRMFIYHKNRGWLWKTVFDHTQIQQSYPSNSVNQHLTVLTNR